MSSKKTAAKTSKPKIDLEGVLAPERLRPLQFVHGAFLLSSLGVSGMTFLAKPSSPTPQGIGLVQLLAMIGIVLWVVGYALGTWLFHRRLKAESLYEVVQARFRGPAILAATATDADKIAHHLQRAWSMRLAAWIIGPVVSLLSVQAAIQGNLLVNDSSLAVTGTFPMVVFFAIAILTFPTAPRVKALLERSLGIKKD